MEYNFASLSVELISDLDKKLNKLKKDFVDDVNNFIRVLNDEDAKQNLGEMNTVLFDLFNDEIKKTVISFTGTMNKVQTSLRQYL
jgi:hypothetical protein